MTWTEFVDWMAYNELESFGPERADWNAAMIAATIAEANRDNKKRKKPFTVKDFIFRLKETDTSSQADWQSMKARFQRAASVANRKK
jgi:hypothetical protein